METLAIINEPGLILDELVSSCDDAAWRLHAAATAVGGRAGQKLAELAERCEEQSLELISVRVPFVSRRFEAMYERAGAQVAGNRMELAWECLETQAFLIEKYHDASEADLPAAWAVLVERHLDELLASRGELKRLVSSLPSPQNHSLAETGS